MAALCKNQIQIHDFEFKQMKEMIRRFDEVLSVKANNYSLKELELRIGENFLKKSSWNELQNKFDSVTGNIEVKFQQN